MNKSCPLVIKEAIGVLPALLRLTGRGNSAIVFVFGGRRVHNSFYTAVDRNIRDIVSWPWNAQ